MRKLIGWLASLLHRVRVNRRAKRWRLLRRRVNRERLRKLEIEGVGPRLELWREDAAHPRGR